MIQRRIKNYFMLSLICLLSCFAAAPFFYISWYVVEHGAASLTFSFFTALPKGPGEMQSGMANAIAGSAWMLLLSSLIAIPWGIGAGVFLSEYGYGRSNQILRFGVDLLASTPSIVIGIFVYCIVVVNFGFSAYAGALALSILMLPIVARSTEEILKLIPKHIREAGLALGIPRWKVIVRILLPGSRAGLLTGIMLAIARVAGETAPLLFTALGNQYFSTKFSEPTASLPVQIYNFAKSGYYDLEQKAWSGALVLVAFVFILNLLTRLMFRTKRQTV